jgi:hypothetical protein
MWRAITSNFTKGILAYSENVSLSRKRGLDFQFWKAVGKFKSFSLKAAKKSQ